MFSYLYNLYYYNPTEIDTAKEQILFFEDRIKNIVCKNISETEKEEKIQRIRQTIECIKYTYSLY